MVLNFKNRGITTMLSKSKIRQQRNEEKVQKVLNLIAKGVPVNKACEKVKISKPTFYHWRRIFVENKTCIPSFIVQSLYAKRLQEELKTNFELPVTKQECMRLVAQMLGEKPPAHEFEYNEDKNTYIELTHHQIGKY